MKRDELEILMGLGFTNLEAKIYITLLQNPESTGYKVAKLLGKPIPNTYKALNKLKAKKAVLSDESVKNRIYTPVSIKDYLDARELEFKNKRIILEEKLNKYERKDTSEGIYKIEEVKDLYLTVEKLIKEAKDVILLDAFPAPLQKISSVLKEAGGKGIKVIVKAYGPIEILNCQVNVTEHDTNFAKYFFAEWINMVVDGNQIVFGLLNRNGQDIYDSFWSNKIYLSLNIYNGFMMEILFNEIDSYLFDESKNKEDIKEMIKKYYPLFFNIIPAFEDFSTRFVSKENIYKEELCCLNDKRKCK